MIINFGANIANCVLPAGPTESINTLTLSGLNTKVLDLHAQLSIKNGGTMTGGSIDQEGNAAPITLAGGTFTWRAGGINPDPNTLSSVTVIGGATLAVASVPAVGLGSNLKILQGGVVVLDNVGPLFLENNASIANSGDILVEGSGSLISGPQIINNGYIGAWPTGLYRFVTAIQNNGVINIVAGTLNVQGSGPNGYSVTNAQGNIDIVGRLIAQTGLLQQGTAEINFSGGVLQTTGDLGFEMAGGTVYLSPGTNATIIGNWNFIGGEVDFFYDTVARDGNLLTDDSGTVNVTPNNNTTLDVSFLGNGAEPATYNPILAAQGGAFANADVCQINPDGYSADIQADLTEYWIFSNLVSGGNGGSGGAGGGNGGSSGGGGGNGGSDDSGPGGQSGIGILPPWPPVEFSPSVEDPVVSGVTAAVALNVLATAEDEDGYNLTVTSVSSPLHGTATINGDNTITYTPTAGTTASSDAFTYTVSDGYTVPATGTVTILLGAAPPVANDVIAANVTAAVTLNVLASDSDAAGYNLTVTGVSAPHTVRP